MIAGILADNKGCFTEQAGIPCTEEGEVDAERILLNALAGLWHDMGKFALRSGEGMREVWDEHAKHDVAYRHALASDSFVQEYAPERWRGRLAGVRYHHRPANLRSISDEAYSQACVVQVADWLSSGERDENAEGGPARLRSPFSRLRGHDAPFYLPLKPLSDCSEHLFPSPCVDEKGVPVEEYRELWSQFAAQARQTLLEGSLHRMDLRTFVETAYFLLQEYAWCVPSAYYNQVPDVSLFDHARATAAIAACLTADDREVPWLERLMRAIRSPRDDGNDTEALDTPVATLVGGDLTGLQRFLYSISSENAAKSLRGRSVYLQLLSELAAEFVVDGLGLPITNLLYAGGGNFYLLVQTTWEGDRIEKRLHALQRQVVEMLAEAHGGDLGLALASTPITPREFFRGHFHEAWARLHQEIRRAKQTPLGALAPSRLAEVIGDGIGTGGETAVCPVCGRESEGGTEDRVCSVCASLESLGMQVARANYMVLADIDIAPTAPQSARSWQSILSVFGRSVHFAKDAEDLAAIAEDLSARAKRLRVLCLAEGRGMSADGLNAFDFQLPTSVGYRPFARLVPWRDREESQIKTFDDLAEQAKGIERWGVLRMDVDNLGRLMREGFRKRDAHGISDSLTISRLASVSFALRDFFDKCVAWAALQADAASGVHGSGSCPDTGRSSRLYLQYAGGDDLFLVGAWDALPLTAAEIQAAFQEFVCHNPAVTISAGIALLPPKFPIYQAAHLALDALGAAKARTGGVFYLASSENGGKNAINFLGVSLDWDSFRTVHEQARKMAQWLEDGVVPRSLPQRILRLYHEWYEGRRRSVRQGRLRPRQRYFGPWVWHAAYQISRAASEIEDTEVKQEIRRWVSELPSDERNIMRLAMAARWAELCTRKRKDGNAERSGI